MIREHFKMARSLARLQEGRADWYRIENSAAKKASIYLYDEIGYVGITAKDFVRDLNEVSAPEIELHLDTPGGEVFDGITIYNALRDHPASITVIVDSMAASAGSFIAQAGDHRIMNRNSTMMIHDGHGMVIGNASDMASMVESLDRVSNNIASIYAERAGGSGADWREKMRAETWYTADEAVEAGLADEVRGKDAQSKNSFDLSVFSYAGRDNAPEPVLTTEVTPEEPQGTDWNPFIDALKGAFA